jgi:hypothetical protein
MPRDVADLNGRVANKTEAAVITNTLPRFAHRCSDVAGEALRTERLI